LEGSALTVVSPSGVRGVFGSDLSPDMLIGLARNFATEFGEGEILLARDTRASSPIVSRLAGGATLGAGVNVVDYGVISTPALFRESRKTDKSAIMVTASHNEPEWNGLKFIVRGRGINQEQLDSISMKSKDGGPVVSGSLRKAEGFAYNSDLVAMAGEDSARGVKVVLDLNGGAAIGHAPEILRSLGCEVLTIGDMPGTFNRTVDPTNDPLDLLCKTVKREGAHAGFAFDSDGDRLVLVDNEGKKRTGDYMLSLAFKEMLQSQEEKQVVVSVDTSQAVDDVLGEFGGRVYRAKVGEANVVGMLLAKEVRIGGEGSSAGLIDASFNYCRDSLLAATTIVAALKKKGVKLYGQVKSYHQARLTLELPRAKALKVMKRLQKELKGADALDGLKVKTSKSSWVLLRSSNTEDGVRVSAEAATAKDAEQLAKTYLAKARRAAA